MSKIRVLKRDDLHAAASTPGIIREVAFESANYVVVRARTVGGVVSGWHHHGAHDYFAYMVSGKGRLEYGPGGREAVEVEAGDFFHVPLHTVHCDVNPDPKEGQLAIIFFVGTGPMVVNVDGPES